MSDIYPATKADHDKPRPDLETIIVTSGALEKRKAAWDAFYHDVKCHSIVEMETFHPKLIWQAWGRDATRHSVREHAEINDPMAELHDMDMGHGARLERFRSLRHGYEHQMNGKRTRSSSAPER